MSKDQASQTDDNLVKDTEPSEKDIQLRAELEEKLKILKKEYDELLEKLNESEQTACTLEDERL